MASLYCVSGRRPGELDCPVVIMSGHGTVDTAVEATRLGAFDFVEKTPVSREAVAHRRAGTGGIQETERPRAQFVSIIAGTGRTQPAHEGVTRECATNRQT